MLIFRGTGPLLLGIPSDGGDGKEAIENPWRSLPQHDNEGQVQLDVNRAFIYYPVGELPFAILYHATSHTLQYRSDVEAD